MVSDLDMLKEIMIKQSDKLFNRGIQSVSSLATCMTLFCILVHTYVHVSFTKIEPVIILHITDCTTIVRAKIVQYFTLLTTHL